MSAAVFLAPREVLLGGDRVVVDGSEGRHAVSVRRLRVGEPVELTDGAGLRVIGTVAAAERPDRLVVDVVERMEVAPETPRMVVVQAIPKGDRGELAVATLTEVGVDVIVPWSASRCIATWKGERGEKAWAKWESTARESGKQARRSHLPQVHPLATTNDVVALIADAASALVLHEAATDALAVVVPTNDGGGDGDGDVVVIVGPEGGIAPEELAAFVAAGAAVVRLGSSVMRTSTAGAAGVSVLMAATGRWS